AGREPVSGIASRAVARRPVNTTVPALSFFDLCKDLRLAKYKRACFAATLAETGCSYGPSPVVGDDPPWGGDAGDGLPISSSRRARPHPPVRGHCRQTQRAFDGTGRRRTWLCRGPRNASRRTTPRPL